MAQIIRDNWATELDAVVNLRFREGLANRAATMVGSTLFNMQRAPIGGTVNVTSAGAVSPDAWDNYENAGVVSQADFDKYYLKTYTHKEYPLEVAIQRKLLDDGNTTQIFNIPFRLGDSAMVKRETDMASVFVNAFDSNFAGGDAVELCDGAHPHSAAKSGATQSNVGTDALTAANISKARRLMRAFTDDAGNPMGSNGNLVLVPNELETAGRIAVGSPQDPDSANNANNPASQNIRLVVWDYLTDANAWFLIDAMKMMQMLDFFDRVPVSIVPKVEDKTINATWIAYMRYSFGFSSWQWVYGNNPS